MDVYDMTNTAWEMVFRMIVLNQKKESRQSNVDLTLNIWVKNARAIGLFFGCYLVQL